MEKNKKYRLPEREWFTLEGAAKEIGKKTGEDITGKDLIYYASQGFIELSVNLSFEFDAVKGLSFSLSNRNDFINDQILALEVRAFSSNDEIIKHKGELAQFIYDELVLQDQRPETRREYVNGVKKIVSTNIYQMKGFFAIDFIDFERLVLNEENFSISSYETLFRFCRSEKYTNDLGITLRVFDKDLNDGLFLNAKDIFVTRKEIYNFLNGNRINSLNTFDSYIKEWDKPTRHSLEINSCVTRPQKEKEVEQRNKGGRPQNPLKNEVIRIAKDTFEHYKGNITRLELAGRISSYIKEKYKKDISEETVKKYLTEQKIGNRKGTKKIFKIIDTI